MCVCVCVVSLRRRLHRQTTMKRSRHPSSSDDSDNGSKQTVVSADSFTESPNIDLSEGSATLPPSLISQVKVHISNVRSADQRKGQRLSLIKVNDSVSLNCSCCLLKSDLLVSQAFFSHYILALQFLCSRVVVFSCKCIFPSC